jgi:phage head maturation protease
MGTFKTVQREAAATAALQADTIAMIASDESVDRYGDIIRAAHWDLTAYKANPVVLFQHKSENIVGTADVRIVGKRLIADIELADAGTSAIVDAVRALVAQKILKASSVGFRPTVEPNVLRDAKNDMITGYEYIGQELLELSLVAVPANPKAVSLLKSFPTEVQQALLLHDPAAVSAFVAQQRDVIAALRTGVTGR